MAATQQTTILSDDDDDEYLDELVSDEDESEDDNVKPVVTPVNRILKGKLPPPRNHPLSTKQIHGEWTPTLYTAYGSNHHSEQR